MAAKSRAAELKKIVEQSPEKRPSLLYKAVSKADAVEFLERKNAKWQNTSLVKECQLCKNGFSLVNRKHHCRECGGVFCGRCTSYKIVITGGLKRACLTCYNRITLKDGAASYTFSSDSSTTADRHRKPISVPGSERAEGGSSEQSGSGNTTDAETINSALSDDNPHSYSTSNKYNNSNNNNINNMNRNSSNGLPPWVEALMFVRRHGEDHGDEEGNVEAVFPEESLPPGLIKDIRSTALLNPYRPSKQQDFRFLFRVRDKTAAGAGTETEITNTTVFYNCYVLYRQQVVRGDHSSASAEGVGGSAGRVAGTAAGVSGGDQNRGSDLFSSVGLGGDGVNANRESERGSIVAEELGFDEEDPDLMRQALILVSKWPFPKIAFRILEKLDEAFVWQADPATMSSASLGGGPMARSNRSGSMSISMVGGGGKGGNVTRRTSSMSFDLGIETGLDIISSALGGATRSGALSLGGGPSAVGNGSGDAGGVGSRGGSLSSAGGVFSGEDNALGRSSTAMLKTNDVDDETSANVLMVGFGQMQMWPKPIPGKSIYFHFLGEMIPFQVAGDALTTYGANMSFAPVFASMNLVSLFGPHGLLQYLWTLWELVVSAQDIIVFSTSPTQCSEFVLALASLMLPLSNVGDIRPYIEGKDSDMRVFAMNAVEKSRKGGETADAAEEEERQQQQQLQRQNSEDGSVSSHNGRSTRTGSVASSSTVGGPGVVSAKSSGGGGGYSGLREARQRSTIVGISDPYALSRLEDFGAAIFLSPAPAGGAFRDPDAVLNGLRPRNSAFCVQLGVGGVTGDAGSTAGTALSHIAGAPPVFVTNAFASASATGLLNIGNAGAGGLGGLGGLGTGSGAGNPGNRRMDSFYEYYTTWASEGCVRSAIVCRPKPSPFLLATNKPLEKIRRMNARDRVILGDKLLRDNIKSMTLAFFKPILGECDNTSLEVANIRSIALEREELAHQKDQAAAVEETLTKKTALRHALFLGLAGNVKNLPDWMMRNMPTVILYMLCAVSALALYLAGVPSVLMVGALFIVKIPEKAPHEFEGLLRNYLPYWLLYPLKYRKRMAAAAARAAAAGASTGTGNVNEDYDDDDDDDESEDLDEDGEAGGEEVKEGAGGGRPDFSGVWKRVRLDRYEDLLIAQNMPYLLRKVFLSTALNHVITMSEDLSAARIQEQGGPLQTDDVFLLGGPVQNINMMGKVDFECISYWEGKKFVHRRTRLPEKEIEIFVVREMTPDGQMKISGKIHFLKGNKPDAVGYTYFDFVSDSPHPRPPTSGYPLPPLRVKAKKTAIKNKTSAVRRDFSGVWKRVKLDRYEDLLVAQKIPYLTRMVFISTPLTHTITMSEDLSAARIQEQGGPLKTDDTFLLGGPVQNINMMGKVFFECTSYWEDTKFVHRRTRLPEKEIEIIAVREMISDTQIRISGMVRFLKEDKPDVFGYAYFEKQGPSPTERPPSSGYPVPPLLSSAASDDADVNSDVDVKSAHGGGGGSAMSRQVQAGAASAAEKETAAAAASQAPRDFSGVWKRTRLDRYEDLLAAQNLNFVVRKLMLSTPITHIITMAENLTAVRIQVQGGPVQTDSVFPVGGGEAEISVMGKTTFLNSVYWAGGQLVQKSIVLPEKATEVYTIRELINERTIKITGKVRNLLSNKPDVYGYAYFELVGPSPNEPPAPAPGIKSPLPQFAAEDGDEDRSSSSSGRDAADRDSKKGISGCEEMVARRTATFSGSDLSVSDASSIATASAVTATNAAAGGAGAELKVSVESSEVNRSGGEFSPMNLTDVDNTQPFSTLRVTGGMKIEGGGRNTLLSHSLSPQPSYAMMQRDFSESSTGSCSVASEPQTTTAAATDAGAGRSDAAGAKSTNLGTPSGTKSKSAGQHHHHRHHRSAHSIKQDFSGTWRRTKVLNLDDWIGEQGGGFHDCKLAAELQLQHIITMDLPDLTTVRFQEVDPETGILYTDFSLKIGADFVVTTRRRSIDAAAFSSGVEDGNRNENVSEESPASPISAASKMFGDMSSAHLRDGIDVLPSSVQMRSRAYWYKGNLIVRQLRVDDSLEFCYIRKLQKSNAGNGGGVGAAASGTGNSGKSASFGGIAFSGGIGGGGGAGGSFSDKRLRGGSMGSDMSGSILGEDEEDDEEGAAQIFMMAKLINRTSGRAVESTSWYSRLGPSPYSVIAGDVVEADEQSGCSGCAPPDAADAPTTKTTTAAATAAGSLSIKLPSETSSASASGGSDASAATSGAAGLLGKGGRGAVEAGLGAGGEGRPTTPINIQSVSAALVPSATHQQSAASSAAVAVATAMRNRETRKSITGRHDIPSFDLDNSESESGNDTGMEEDSDFDRSADSDNDDGDDEDDDDDNVESMRSSFIGMDRSTYKHLKRGSKGSGGMMDAAALAVKNAMTTPLESGSTETHSVAGGTGAGGKGVAQPVGLSTNNFIKAGVASSTTAASQAANLYVRVKPFAGEWSRSNGMNLESLAGAEQNALVKKIAANMNVTHLLVVTLNQPGTAGAAVVLRIQEFAGNASLSMKCDVNGAYVDSILANKRYRTRCYLEGQSLVVQRVCLSDCLEVLHKRYLEPVVSSSVSSSCSSSSSSSIPEGSEELDGNGQQKEHEEGKRGRRGGGESERKKMNEATAVDVDREDRGDVTIGMRLVTIHRNLITGEESETMSLFTNMENHVPATPNPVAAAYSANPASLFQRASSVSTSAASGSTGGAAGAAGSGSMFRRSSSTILSAAASKLFGEGTASAGASPTHVSSSSSATETGGGGSGSGGTSTSTSSSPLSQSQSGSVSGYGSGETSCSKVEAPVEVRGGGGGGGSGNSAAASPSSSTSSSSAQLSSAQSSSSPLGNNSQQETPVAAAAAAAGSLPPVAASSTAEVPSSSSDLSEPLPAPPHAAPVAASPRFVSKTPKADEHIQLLKSQLKSQGIAPLEFIELRSIEQELQTLFDAANNGRPLDEARLDHLLKCMEHNPEYQRELAEKARKWRAEILPFARECLLKMRGFVPPNIFRSSVASLTAGEGFLGGKGGESAAGADKKIANTEDEEEEEESDVGEGKEPDLSVTKQSHGPLSPALAKRFMSKKCLWLVRMNTEDIQRLHEGDLFGRYNPEAQGLDIVETAAIYAVTPEKFRVDPTGKKERWRASLEQNLKSMYAVYRENRKALPSTKLRNPVYESEEPQFGGRLTLHEMSPVSSADAFKPRDSFRNLSSRK